MLPSMPVLFPRDSQSGEGFPFAPAPVAIPVEVPAPKAPAKQITGEPQTLAVSSEQQNEEVKDTPSESEEDLQEKHFVTSYYNKVRSKLGIDKFTKFRDLLSMFVPDKDSPVALYRRLEPILGTDELLEEFLMFLTPGQAACVGRFMDHLMLTKIKKFIQHLQSTLARKPTKLRKVMRAVSTAQNASELRARVEPILRTSPRLLQQFRYLFADTRPPDSLYTPEHTEEFPESAWAGDRGLHCLELEETATPPRDDKQPISITYLHGRVFLQQGRVLRPARVSFPGSPLDTHISRLAPVPDPALCPPATTTAIVDSEDEPRKNVKSPKRTQKACVKTKEGKKTKSPERSAKCGNETCKKTVRIVLDAQIEKRVAATKRSQESSNGPTNTRNSNSVDPSLIQECKEEVKGKRKREHSPDVEIRTEYDEGKKQSKNKQSKRLDAKKTEESKAEEKKNVTKANTVFDKGKSKTKIKTGKIFESRYEKKKKKVCKVKESQGTKEKNKAKDKKAKEHKSLELQGREQNCEDQIPPVNLEDASPKAQSQCNWTREEDKTILLVLKKESESEETFMKMKALLPHRTVKELQDRFFHVMDLLRQMALGEVT